MTTARKHLGAAVATLLLLVVACSQWTPTTASSCDAFGAGCSPEELQTQLESVGDRLAAAQAGAPYEDIYNPDLVQCTTTSYSGSAAVIGPAGGVLSFGPHHITFPAGALSNDVVVSGEMHISNHVLVELSPHGLQMAVPAVLDLRYGQCQSGESGLDVVYVDDDLKILSHPDTPSGSTPSGRVRAELWHFSKYAVAY